MQTKKQQKLWKRSFNSFLATALVASSVSFVEPQQAKAASAADYVGPGGVNITDPDFLSYIDIEKSPAMIGNKFVLKDLAGEFNWNNAMGAISEQHVNGGEINFHQATDGKNTGMLFSTTLITDIPFGTSQEREVFSVQKSGGIGFPWEFSKAGDKDVSYSDSKIITNFATNEVKTIEQPTEKVSAPNILRVVSTSDMWNLSINGRIQAHAPQDHTPRWTKGVSSNGFEYFGYGDYEPFKNGNIAEMLVFNRKLTDIERPKVNSYLALKYGITLKNGDGTPTDYIASDGSTMWTASENTSYGHRITGIGLDGAGGINQKQSKSQAEDAIVTIALGNTIEALNKENTGEITNDLSFFTFSDNGATASYNTIIDNANLPATLAHENDSTNTTKMMPRVFKVEKSATWADQTITLKVDGVDLNSYQYHLFVNDSDNTFPKATTTAYPVDQATGTVTLDSSAKLVNGSFYTFVQYVDKTDLETLVNATDAENLQQGDYTSSSWSLFQNALTDAKAALTDSGKTTAEVKAALDALNTAKANLKEVTSLPTISVTAPTGTVTTGKPTFKGTATPGSEVSVKVGGIILTATADADGNWSVIPDTDIPDGAYTVEVTASIDGETSTPVTKEITIDTATQSPTVTITAPTGTVTTGKPAFTGTATPGSEVSVKVGDIILTATADADGNWSVIPDTDIPDGAYMVEVTASIDGETSTPVTKVITINTKTPPVLTPGLGSLVPSQGALSPSFSSEVTNYTMNVGYATSHLSFLATPITPGASVTTTVNGQLGTLAQFPLQVGENIIGITVADGNGNVRHYTIKVYREAYTGGGNSGGGSTWTPDPTPPPSETKTKIQVELEIDGDNPLEKTTVEIERTKHVNGEVTDFVNLTQAQALEAVEKAKQIGNSIARIVIPDVKDEVDKVTVEIPKQSLHTLRDNGLSLEISTVNGHIAIPQSSMASIDDNFYFRLVPVKKESERQAIEERAKVEKVVRETLQSNDVRVVARPMTIETNMPSRPVQVTLPLRDVKVPTEAAAHQVFLEQLAVFIEHSDGEKVVVFPDVVTMANGELGLRFTVEKFSTFTIIQFDKQEVEQPEIDEHEAYIKGFPNGTFGPDKNVTRAQVAIMMARILGYTEGQALNKAPFKDVAKNHSAAGAITFVKEQGIMNGDQNGNFHANANITRAEMAAVVANYKQLYVEEGVAITFKDTNGHWAQWIIEANRAAGIINGLENGSFAPNAALTRAQAVVMMNRMFERGPLHGVTKPSFPDVKATHWAFNEIEEAANSHSYLIDEDGKEQLSK